MRFNLIREPAPLAGSRQENPADLLKSYRQQNIMMQKIRVLHTAFDGIKLTNWSDSNRELPNILVGSVCEFGGRLFETTDNIILTDNDETDGERFIRLEIVRENPASDSDDDYLIAEVVSSGMPEYDYYNRGFYTKENDLIKYKYLRVAMKYNKTLGGYVEKKYWNISDLMRAGMTFKKHSVSFEAGEHEFEVPDSANTITVHLVSGGGGGAEAYWGKRPIDQTEKILANYYGANGGESKIIIDNKTIVSCGGGVGGKAFNNANFSTKGTISPGAGGIVTYNKDDLHVDYINGKSGLTNNFYSETGNNGGILTYTNNDISGGYGGRAPSTGFHQNVNGGAGGGAGSYAIALINRTILDGSKIIKIIVGVGGNGAGQGSKGQDGSAVVEYFTRG